VSVRYLLIVYRIVSYRMFRRVHCLVAEQVIVVFANANVWNKIIVTNDNSENNLIGHTTLGCSYGADCIWHYSKLPATWEGVGSWRFRDLTFSKAFVSVSSPSWFNTRPRCMD